MWRTEQWQSYEGDPSIAPFQQPAYAFENTDTPATYREAIAEACRTIAKLGEEVSEARDAAFLLAEADRLKSYVNALGIMLLKRPLGGGEVAHRLNPDDHSDCRDPYLACRTCMFNFPDAVRINAGVLTEEEQAAEARAEMVCPEHREAALSPNFDMADCEECCLVAGLQAEAEWSQQWVGRRD